MKKPIPSYQRHRWFVSLGIGGDSPFRGKERDTFGLGGFYTGASNEFGPFAKAAFAPRDGYGWERYCQLKSNWADFLPRASNLNAEQSMSYEFVYCLIFVQIPLT